MKSTRAGPSSPEGNADGPNDDVRWLISAAGAQWLATAHQELISLTQRQPTQPAPDAMVKLQGRLRKDLSAERARLVTLQLELRLRAKEKFSLSEQMFFTRKGLEQATDEAIAVYKAERFVAGGTIVDLCCGIGGDLLALARRGSALGLDRDAVAALLAQANAKAYGLTESQVSVEQKDAGEVQMDQDTSWHCDPDRRPHGRRTAQVEFGEPSLATLERLLQHNPNAAIKLAPAAQVPPTWQDRAELEWIGSRGECRQQVAWFGKLARHAGIRSATIVEADAVPRTFTGDPREAVPAALQLGRYLYEPHAAVLAANLAGLLCQEHALAPISEGVAYLTGDQIISDAALDAFEIRDVLPLDRKQLKAYCRERGISRLEVKKRRVDVDPARLRKEVVGNGDEEATFIVLPMAGSIRILVARRLANKV